MIRRRGTVIVETKKGILLTAMRSKTFLLPGGGVEKGETGFIAAIRELYEETGLKAYDAKIIFKHRSRSHIHTVVLAKAAGTPKPRNEVKHLDYYVHNKDIKMSTGTKDILKKYLDLKKEN